jgi:hypothetical protein
MYPFHVTVRTQTTILVSAPSRLNVGARQLMKAIQGLTDSPDDHEPASPSATARHCNQESKLKKWMRKLQGRPAPASTKRAPPPPARVGSSKATSDSPAHSEPTASPRQKISISAPLRPPTVYGYPGITDAPKTAQPAGPISVGIVATELRSNKPLT